MTRQRKRILALTGGVGGAKLCLGLTHCLDADALTFVVNTGDDFEHLGLHICPDLDTLLYTLSDQADPDRGWGRREESWACLETLASLGGESWFRLGDRDLATHLLRTDALARGHSLTEITATLATRLGIEQRILPMSDDPVRTRIATPDGELAFQHYFVRERCAPTVTGFRFEGASAARASPAVLEALADPALAGVLICPSNPFVSIDPILALPALRAALDASPAPVVAVSPIIAGAAIKGPTAKMMEELGVPRTSSAVAAHYGTLLDGFLIDEQDASLAEEIRASGVATEVAPTLMVSLDDRIALARRALDFLDALDHRAAS
ncbi:MAG: 2-phospho-L-lactate transferase [Pseudomonadales bacterium]|nr:2-phospho-L-lactate transferase [Pseudomonadales bacterium]